MGDGQLFLKSAGEKKNRFSVSVKILMLLTTICFAYGFYLVYDWFNPRPLTKTFIPSIKRDLGLEVRRENMLKYGKDYFKDGEPRAVWADFDVTGQDTKWREGLQWTKTEPGWTTKNYSDMKHAKCEFTIVSGDEYNFSLYYMTGQKRTILYIARATQNQGGF